MDDKTLIDAALCELGETEFPWDYRITDDVVVIITAAGAKHRLEREKLERVALLMDAVDKKTLTLLRDEGLLGETSVTEDLLRKVPGIGAVTARKILTAIRK